MKPTSTITLDPATASARYERLFADVIARQETLLQGLSFDGLACLDLFARCGHLSRALRVAGARLLWASDLPEWLAVYRQGRGGARRFLSGELGWLPMHPHLRAEAPAEGFDVLICGSDLSLQLPTERSGVEAALLACAALLRDGGRLIFDLPARRATERPSTHRVDGRAPMWRTRQRHGAQFWEVRVTQGLPPCTLEGPCLEWRAWRSLLRASGFLEPQRDALPNGRARVVAHRSPRENPDPE